MKLDHDFFQVSKLSEDQKKGILAKNWRVFSLNLSEDQSTDPNIIQRSDADQSQIIWGDADVDHSQIIGGMQSNYWGGYIPLSPPPPGFRHPCLHVQNPGNTDVVLFT